MQRYALLAKRVAQLEGVELLEAPRLDRQDLLRVHDADYVERALSGRLSPQEQRKLGFPWSPALVERSLRSCGATRAAALEVSRGQGYGVAVNLAGGTHHAFAGRGEGFCLFNDCVVAAQSLLAEGLRKRIALVDCDVHQGDGSAALCQGEPRIFTLSLHGQKNYPFRKQSSDLDIELADGCDDETYLQALAEGWRAVAEFGPQLVFYLAGADPYEKDRLGRLALTQAGLARRDQWLFERCRQGAIPVVVVMAGGYAEPIEDTAEIQARTVALALESLRFQATTMGQKEAYGRIV